MALTAVSAVYIHWKILPIERVWSWTSSNLPASWFYKWITCRIEFQIPPWNVMKLLYNQKCTLKNIHNLYLSLLLCVLQMDLALNRSSHAIMSTLPLVVLSDISSAHLNVGPSWILPHYVYGFQNDICSAVSALAKGFPIPLAFASKSLNIVFSESQPSTLSTLLSSAVL